MTATKLVYVAGSPYSGSTLLSLALNEHPDLMTVGHMMGWEFAAGDKFECSCGALVKDCRFFKHIQDCYHEAGLDFSVFDFDIAYRLVKNDRLNRILVGRFPVYANNYVEQVRDTLVTRLPRIAERLKELDERNQLFVNAALIYKQASVFVDNSHEPHRVLHLQRAFGDRLFAIHLVRDIRGVALSNRKNKSWPVAVSKALWIKRQQDTIRIINKLDIPSMQIMYEDFCQSPQDVLTELYNRLGMESTPFTGLLGRSEHHVLGNDMRMSAKSITLTENWRSKLDTRELEYLRKSLEKLSNNAAQPEMRRIADYYLER